MKTKEEIEQLAKSKFITNKNISLSESNKTMCRRSAFIKGYTQCQEDMVDKDKWTFEEILNACYPTLGRGSDWCEIVKRLTEQKLNKQD